jgi:1-acyl-sn-glycerol-3-phosphate acyltransferase
VSATREDVVSTVPDVATPLPGPSGLSRAWRALRTGVAFAVFGLGALAIGTLAVPLVRALSRSRSEAEGRVQRLIHHAFRLFAWFMATIGLIRVTWVGRDALRDRPLLVVANHPTLIDVVLLVAAMPQAVCIVKTAAERRPLFRRIVQAAGYIPNARPRDGPSSSFPRGRGRPAAAWGRSGAARRGSRCGAAAIWCRSSSPACRRRS